MLQRNGGAHAPSRVSVGASPTESTSRKQTFCTQSEVTHCGEAPHAAREARGLPGPLLLTALVFLASASSLLATYPNRIKDAEDELFGGAAPSASTGVPTWSVSEPYINLWIIDQPLTYTTSYGQPVGFGIAFKQRNLRSNSKIFGLGPTWESSWLSYLEYTTSGGTVTAGSNYVKLGGARVYVANGEAKQFKSSGRMTKLTDGGGAFTGFRIDFPSGAQEIYTNLLVVSSSENYALLSDQIDPVGRALHLTYDLSGGWAKLTQVTDFDGRTSTIVYDATYTKQIREVDDPYGRKAYFGYDGSGRLNTITNVGGLNSSFSYDAQGLITNLTTAYGSTSFAATTNQFGAAEYLGGTNQVNRSLLVTLPDGNKQLFLYRDQS